jgi:hypothetical protein
MRRTYFRAMQAKCERPEETCLLLEPLTVRIMEELKGIMLGSITARASVLDSVALLKSGTEASRTNRTYTTAPSRLRSCSGLTGTPQATNVHGNIAAVNCGYDRVSASLRRDISRPNVVPAASSTSASRRCYRPVRAQRIKPKINCSCRCRPGRSWSPAKSMSTHEKN